MDRRVAGRLAAMSGVVGVAGNILGVVLLGPIGSAYRAGTIVPWTREVMAAPDAATLSALSFVAGLLALAGWAALLGRRLDTLFSRAAGTTIAVGAVLNAAGSLAPLVVAWHLPGACATEDACLPAGVAVLGLALSLDALFNFLLGAGLLVLAGALWTGRSAPADLNRRPAPLLAILTGVAGLASLPVSLQFVSDDAARLLAIAGPLWLTAILIASVQLWRNRL